MKYIKLVIIFLLPIIILNCSTSYQPKGISGGYSEEKVLENLYRVEYEGNQHTKPEKIQNYLLYRCAELTNENGYKYFAILTEERHFDELSSRPERAPTATTRTSSSGGTRTIVNPDLQTATKSTKYRGVYTIKFLDEIDKKYKNVVFNTQDVIQQIGTIINK